MRDTFDKTAAWPLAAVYSALMVYASLYPFADWRIQGVAPWAFLGILPSRYWSGFDVVTNLLGYMPLGFLYCLARLRTGVDKRRWRMVLEAMGVCGMLSLVMEMMQNFLPVRVPSNLDLLLNTLGGLLGAACAAAFERLGILQRWSRFRARWFIPRARGGLVLLALWPFALLFPASVPFGLGQVVERLESTLAEVLEDTPFLDWLPVRDVELQPLVPGVEMLCVAFGLLGPCLLGYSIMSRGWRRTVFLLCLLSLGLGVTALSAALSYGPAHAWAWASLPVQVGLGVAVVLALLMIPVPTAGCAALFLLVLVLHCAWLNQAPTNAYFAQTLQTWEQGRFIRFNGLAQWVGWLWPYVAIAVVLRRLSLREDKFMPPPMLGGRRVGDTPIKSGDDLSRTTTPFPNERREQQRPSA